MNIYDIAEQCGVSIATVSRVLNNNPNVSAATRAKVMAAMEAAHYTPSALARGLGSGAMKMVGVLCPSLRDPYYAEMLTCIEKNLRQKGLPMLLRCGGTSAEEMNEALRAMVQSHVSAILLIGGIPPREGEKDLLPVVAEQLPVILLDGDVSVKGVHCVTGDHKSAVSDLVGMLVRRQRRRILLLHDTLTYACQQKITGYTEAYASYGLTVDPDLIIGVDADLDTVNQCVKQLLVKRVTFDAIIGTEDLLALGAQKALGRTGLSMPIIGSGNTLSARCATPQLTSVDCQPHLLCETGIRLLTDLLDGKAVNPHTILPTQLVERDTFRNN